ncbi:MAG TPA: 4Fe-4S dicluster domain-containing protein [Candidatus Nanoarchaeia archaeon]|nr:4Fe-4S dicluster domain-containing protein [Candidatus Nanoarchaeia archaeon]
MFQAKGVVDKIGMVFVVMCLATTSISFLLGIFISPRAWCSFCPMGTVQRWEGGRKYQLKFDKGLCVNCNLCNKICPMQLTVNNSEIKPDCIKCGKCVKVCPKKALMF